jgi:hypothetical protein
MSAIDSAARFLEALVRHGVRYHLDIVRNGFLMLSLAVPGERWEVEFLEDGTVELERFITQGVEGCAHPLGVVLERYE